MEYAVISQTNEKRVMMCGQFTFSDNLKFKQILDLLSDDGVKHMTLDFGDIDFIDSAGLGMLLLLRDACQSRNVALSITSAHGQVQKIFLISKFDQLFSMIGADDATRH